MGDASPASFVAAELLFAVGYEAEQPPWTIRNNERNSRQTARSSCAVGDSGIVATSSEPLTIPRHKHLGPVGAHSYRVSEVAASAEAAVPLQPQHVSRGSF